MKRRSAAWWCKPSAAETEKRLNTETRGCMPIQWVLAKPEFKFLRQPSWPLRLHFVLLTHRAAPGDSGRLSSRQKLQSAAAPLTLSRAASGSDSEVASRPHGLAVNSYWNGQVSFLFFYFFCRSRLIELSDVFLPLTWPDLPWLTALRTYRGWTVTNSRATWSHHRGFWQQRSGSLLSWRDNVGDEFFWSWWAYGRTVPVLTVRLEVWSLLKCPGSLLTSLRNGFDNCNNKLLQIHLKGSVLCF